MPAKPRRCALRDDFTSIDVAVAKFGTVEFATALTVVQEYSRCKIRPRVLRLI
jgi:hypothetical protein